MSILTLCVIFTFKHLIADYFLQGKYMLGKFKEHGWVLPLASHCAVHAAFTLVIAWAYTNKLNLAFSCAFIDAFIHFVMDRIKASPNYLGRYESLSKNEFKYYMEQYSHAEKLGLDKRFIERKFKENTYFWWALGVDQTVHHLTDLLIIGIIVGVVN